MKYIKRIVLGAIILLGLVGRADAQVSWVYYQNLPSNGTTKADFTNWLNRERSIRGLPEVQYDILLDEHSRYNSYLQSIYGLGHHYIGPARRQNASAVPDFSRVGTAWLLSPGHFSALMDPTITHISIEMYDIYTTFSAR